jgi:hypothetical protein
VILRRLSDNPWTVQARQSTCKELTQTLIFQTLDEQHVLFEGVAEQGRHILVQDGYQTVTVEVCQLDI